MGVNECTGCTIEWQPVQFLILDDPIFPLVTGEDFPQAFDATFHALITGPNGCQISDMYIRFYDASGIIIDITPEIKHCSADYAVTVDLKADIAYSVFKVYLYDKIAQEEIEMQLQSGGTKRLRKYNLSIDRDIDRDFELIARFEFGDECAPDEICEFREYVGDLPKSNYTGNWAVHLPNVFAPGSPNPAQNTWFPGFYSEDLNCQNPSAVNNNVFRMKVQVWDEWGNFFWEKEVIKDIYDTQGVIYTNMMWDGRVDGQLVNQGVYVFKVWINSCYGIAGYSTCYAPDCPCTDLDEYGDCTNWYACGEDEENYYVYNVTIL